MQQRCSPVGFEETNCHVVETTMWQVTVDSLWGLKASVLQLQGTSFSKELVSLEKDSKLQARLVLADTVT